MGFPHTPHERETLVLSKHFGEPEAIGLDGWRKRGGYAALEKAVRVNGNELVITLPRPFGPFLGIMARWSYVVSKSWAISHGNSAWTRWRCEGATCMAPQIATSPITA